MLNDLKKLKVNNLTYLVKDRKSSYKLVRMTKNPQGDAVSEEEEEEDNDDDYNGDYYVEFLHNR